MQNTIVKDKQILFGEQLQTAINMSAKNKYLCITKLKPRD